MGKDIRYVRSGIEDLAFSIRRSREPGKAGLRVCIEHRFVLSKTPGEKQSITGFSTAML
jgi:hypothetical protein